MDLRTAVSMLPTPRARDGKGAGYEDDLPSTVGRLLPTPAASNPNDGESLESWEARRQRNLAKGINGNGQGTPLGIAVRMLSNPSAPPADAASGCTTPEGSAPDALDAPTPTSDGPVKLLPTPAASFPGSTANFRPDGTPYGEGYGMTLLDAVRLLPTPRASDGEKGGPNQRGSKGDLMLPSAVSQLLPTPTSSDGDRTSSTYGRGNPTLTGAITDPPSDGGKPSSDVPPPGPLTLWDV